MELDLAKGIILIVGQTSQEKLQCGTADAASITGRRWFLPVTAGGLVDFPIFVDF